MTYVKGRTVREAVKKALNKQSLPDINLPQSPVGRQPSLNCMSVVPQMERLERELQRAVIDARRFDAAIKRLSNEQLTELGRLAIDIAAIAAAPTRILSVATRLRNASRLQRAQETITVGSVLTDSVRGLAFVFGVNDLPERIRRLNASDIEMERLKQAANQAIRSIGRIQQNLERLHRFYETNNCDVQQLRGRIE